MGAFQLCKDQLPGNKPVYVMIFPHKRESLNTAVELLMLRCSGLTLFRKDQILIWDESTCRPNAVKDFREFEPHYRKAEAYVEKFVEKHFGKDSSDAVRK